jgi:hypothetical protein
VWSDHVATVSQSPAPVIATVATASGTVVKTLRQATNRVVALDLPTGTYRVCLSQVAAAGWDAAGGCATASWQRARATVARAQPATAHRARNRHHWARSRSRRGPSVAARFTP